MKGVGIKEICEKYFLPKDIVKKWAEKHNVQRVGNIRKYVFSEDEQKQIVKDCVDDVRLRASRETYFEPINLSVTAKELGASVPFVFKIAKEIGIEGSVVLWGTDSKRKTYFASLEQTKMLVREVLSRKGCKGRKRKRIVRSNDCGEMNISIEDFGSIIKDKDNVLDDLIELPDGVMWIFNNIKTGKTIGIKFEKCRDDRNIFRTLLIEGSE